MDDDLKKRLKHTLADMRKQLLRIPDNREDLFPDSYHRDFQWITDFDNLDSIANIALRKTDLINFATFNEGDLHNNLFFKVLILESSRECS